MPSQPRTQTFFSAGIPAALNALKTSIAQRTEKGDQVETPVPHLSLFRRDAPTEPMTYLYERSVCVIAQGTKQVMLGGETYVYDPRRFLVTCVELPVVCQVLKASREKPYLSLLLKLDHREVSQLMADHDLPLPRAQHSGRGMAIGAITLPLLTAFQRLVDLLDEPNDIPILAPIIEREIAYRLLVSEQGARLRQMASAGSQSQQVARAIYWLKNNFSRPLRIEELASYVNMSPSTFHHHFRMVTAMSPLQYQKRLRLSEARRLMFAERLDATSAAFQVGYESPSQFSREYSRSFGAPPMRDVERLRRVSTN